MDLGPQGFSRRGRLVDLLFEKGCFFLHFLCFLLRGEMGFCTLYATIPVWIARRTSVNVSGSCDGWLWRGC